MRLAISSIFKIVVSLGIEGLTHFFSNYEVPEYEDSRSVDGTLNMEDLEHLEEESKLIRRKAQSIEREATECWQRLTRSMLCEGMDAPWARPSRRLG